MIRLLRLEVDELKEHLESRPDIWAQTEDGLYIRFSAATDEALCMLRFIPPAKTGPFALWQLIEMPAAMSAEETTKYVQQLCDRWTSSGTRQQLMLFFVSELGYDPGKATSIAIAVAGIFAGEFPTPDMNWQPPLPDIVELAIAEPIIDQDRMSKTWLLQGGGWVRIKFTGGMFSVKMSIPDRMGYKSLSGHVRSHGVLEPRHVAADLFDWELETSK